MSKPSNIHQKPSNKKMIYLNEQLTRELSNISNEGYHGVGSSIPFVWESQPGTPKVRSRERSLPPLTPPPCYLQNFTKVSTIKAKKNSSKSSLLKTIFPKRATRKGCVHPPLESPSLSYSSSSSSSYSVPSSPMVHSRPRSYSVPSSPMVHSRKGEEDEDLYDVTDSSLCFGNARSRGCYSSMFKKVLLGDFM